MDFGLAQEYVKEESLNKNEIKIQQADSAKRKSFDEVCICLMKFIIYLFYFNQIKPVFYAEQTR